MSANGAADPSFNLRLEALGGLCAGIVGTVVGFPLDLIKTRLQTSGGTATSVISHSTWTSTKPTSSIFQIGMNIIRQGLFTCDGGVLLYLKDSQYRIHM